MRCGLAILALGTLVVGCAAKPPQPAPSAAADPIYDDAVVAAALVYDPPAIVNSPKLDVAREGRAMSAFAGFEDVITTYYYLYIDDRQGGYGRDHNTGHGGRNFDRYERQAITVRTGVSYR